MASVKVVLRKRKNKEGKYPIAIRITKNRKTSYIYTGQYIKESEWDKGERKVKKSHPNSTRLNNYILKKLSEANDKLLELDNATAQIIQKTIKNRGQQTTFSQLADQYLENLEKSGKYSTYLADRTRINHFRNFLKNKDVSFKEITEMLLKQFQAYLKSTKKLSDRSVTNNMIVLRSLFNLAIREGIIDQKYYPFGKGKIKVKIPQSVKIGLDIEEVISIEDLELQKGSQTWHTRNVWLTSFYFAGMRISDVLRLKWSDINDERLHYSMGKNNKAGSLKVPEKAMRIFDYYKPEKSSADDFIFPELKKAMLNDPKDINRKIGTAVKQFNKYLERIGKQADIEKKITTHIARHTFGNISGDKIPIQMLQKLYRHTSITTTINYQGNFIFKDADDALEAVINP